MISADEKEKLKREKSSGFFLDMGKLSFAGMVIGSIVSVTSQENIFYLLGKAIVGILLTIVFAKIGMFILKQ